MSNKYSFRTKDFYALLERQKYKCALSGLDLTPQNTIAEHIVPLQQGGKHCFANIYLVETRVSKLKRNLLEQDVIDIAKAIVAHRERSSSKRKKKG
ncbi:MAG: hypothetical protein JNM27_07100 [Leptospirales bacterium]|nr:hypothetical protein [Leptospirales bacterium]